MAYNEPIIEGGDTTTKNYYYYLLTINRIVAMNSLRIRITSNTKLRLVGLLGLVFVD